MDKIVFFHMNQLGDLLFSLPVLKAAKKESGAKIISVVKSSLSPLLLSSGVVDCVIPKEKSKIKLINALRKENDGKAVLFSESPASVLSAYFAGFKNMTGFETAALSFLFTNKVKRIGVPSISNNTELGKAAGFKDIQSDYTGIVNIPEKNISNIKEWFLKNKFNPVNTIAVSAGASKKRRDKCLPVKIWTEIIDSLYDFGYNCVLAGASWEIENLSKISEKSKSSPALFTAENGILDSAAFFSYCPLFIGTDSGAMHLAAALKKKCIGIFTKTDPMQIGPMPLRNHIIIKKNNTNEVSAKEIIESVTYLHTAS
ncbi:MAG: hypothetical protein LBD46_03935 [Endomicrobium sp.]|jgi:ADP-heptose:LPS heptosyltransferase|nr:hypothetical protein [Endomicrobium sp.]